MGVEALINTCGTLQWRTAAVSAQNSLGVDVIDECGSVQTSPSKPGKQCWFQFNS